MKGERHKGKRMTPQQRIMRAYKRGVGLRLTAYEVMQLASDDAVMTLAENDDQRDREIAEADAAKRMKE